MTAVQSIIDRLLMAPTPFKGVAGAVDFAAIEKRPGPSPAAYVMTVEEASGENERATGRVLQRLEADVAVVIVVDNLTDARMAAADADLEGVFKPFIRGRLIGFVPTGADEPLTHVGGRLLKARSGSVWHEDRYALVAYLEEQL